MPNPLSPTPPGPARLLAIAGVRSPKVPRDAESQARGDPPNPRGRGIENGRFDAFDRLLDVREIPAQFLYPPGIERGMVSKR